MEKVRPWCGQPWDRGRLKNRTEICRSFMAIDSFTLPPERRCSTAAGEPIPNTPSVEELASS